MSLRETASAPVGGSDTGGADPVASPVPRFALLPAKRERTPLLLGLVGPSGAGKTCSALRLASGIVRREPGPVVLIDTENRRARHYADQFSFTHIDFAPPFGAQDDVAALHATAEVRPSVIIIDSLSHEHEGEGGMLDQVAAELSRLAGDDPALQQKLASAAWRRPRAARRALLSALTRSSAHVIVCIRAAERVRTVREGTLAEIVDMGLTPLAGPEFLFELTASALLRFGADGVPTWTSALPGEHAAIKRPRHLAAALQDGEALTEATGEKLALWAAGGSLVEDPPPRRRPHRRTRTRAKAAGGAV
jgi:hypothetical protein